MKLEKIVIFGLILIGLCGCGSTTTTATQDVRPGMTADQVSSLLGSPANRSFRKNYEAWQYDDIVGFGQCEYITIWFEDNIVQSMTSRRSGSVAGCGLGSDPIDWDMMPSSAQ